MIPTRLKCKLARRLSYPIGAEALTEGLLGAPHIASFTVSFLDKPVLPASRFQTILAEKHPYIILTSRYEPAQKPGYGGANYMVEGGWYDEKWEFAVYPVVRELRRAANRLLLQNGLPFLVEWLRSSEQAGWLTRCHRIELIFSPTEELLTHRRFDGS